MEFSVPTNWQKELTDKISLANTTEEIKEVYGKLTFDDIGGGRPASSLALISKKKAKKQIINLRNKGFKFNYLLNALCLDNLELTREGQKKFRRLLGWIVDAGVDAVTVAVPYLAMWVKKNYPSLSITVSALANVDSLSKAIFWDDLGVEKITFPGPVINRNFSLIRELKKTIKSKVQLIANNACLANCPEYINHALMNSHASQGWHSCRGYMFDYHLIMCRLKRLEDPVNFIRSDWIRPEDIDFYEGLGVDSIKLVDRRLPSDMLARIINAYVQRSYSGNLLDLFHTFQGKSFSAHKGWIYKLFHLSLYLPADAFRLLKFSRLLSKLEVYIDNKQLDGFIENIPGKCDLISCAPCGYCRRAAVRAVKIDPVYRKAMLDKYAAAMHDIFRGSFIF
ncbi:MAG: U32 family peptidase [Candidatus Omnitrophica bacterium]|nr:U32 family peptidase [Candidatus Omnitrophota bacterium]